MWWLAAAFASGDPYVSVTASSDVYHTNDDNEQLVDAARETLGCRFAHSNQRNGHWHVQVHFWRCDQQTCITLEATFSRYGAEALPPEVRVHTDVVLQGEQHIAAMVASADERVTRLLGAPWDGVCRSSVGGSP